MKLNDIQPGKRYKVCTHVKHRDGILRDAVVLDNCVYTRSVSRPDPKYHRVVRIRWETSNIIEDVMPQQVKELIE